MKISDNQANEEDMHKQKEKIIKKLKEHTKILSDKRAPIKIIDKIAKISIESDQCYLCKQDLHSKNLQ
jgi:hypothetical protein